MINIIAIHATFDKLINSFKLAYNAPFNTFGMQVQGFIPPFFSKICLDKMNVDTNLKESTEGVVTQQDWII